MNRTLLFTVCLAILSRGAFAAESDQSTDDEPPTMARQPDSQQQSQR